MRGGPVLAAASYSLLWYPALTDDVSVIKVICWTVACAAWAVPYHGLNVFEPASVYSYMIGMVDTPVATTPWAGVTSVSDGEYLGGLPTAHGGEKVLDYLVIGVPVIEGVRDPVLLTDSCLLHLVVGNRWIVIPQRCSTMSLFASASLLFMDAPDVFITLQ